MHPIQLGNLALQIQSINQGSSCKNLVGFTVHRFDSEESLTGLGDGIDSHQFPVTRGSLEGSYLELGFGIGGLSREEITRLGFELDQEAIFWIEPKGTWLVPCDGSQPMAVTEWNRRQRSSSQIESRR
ncbi:MAG: hypothetical protein EXS25_02515 [Pedosphaera sp.]|nr:hypothetical protein [Pedosphaera sp.]